MAPDAFQQLVALFKQYLVAIGIAIVIVTIGGILIATGTVVFLITILLKVIGS